MAKPIVNHITPFDADNTINLSFSWNGDQAYANRFIIYNADTLAVVYDKKINSFLLSHSIPANTLQNGKKWLVQCQVFDIEDIASDISDKIFFNTFKNPEFYFSNVSEEQVIKSASYEATVYYFQQEYEDIQSYKFYLYDGTKRYSLKVILYMIVQKLNMYIKV